MDNSVQQDAGDTLSGKGSASRLHVMWDHHFRVLHWSHWAERFFGWAEAEVLGKRPDEWAFIQEDDLEEVQRAMSRLCSGEVQRQVVRWRHLTRKGDAVSCDWYHYALAGSAAETLRVESLVRPVVTRNGKS